MGGICRGTEAKSRMVFPQTDDGVVDILMPYYLVCVSMVFLGFSEIKGMCAVIA